MTDKTAFQWKSFDLLATGHVAEVGPSRGRMSSALASLARGQADEAKPATASAEARQESSDK